MKALLLTASVAIGTVLISSQAVFAQAQGNCAQRDAVIDRLANKYGETRQSMGLGANNAVVEVFASKESGSWTITVTMPTGVTCLVASGQAFETLTEDLAALQGDEV